VIGGLSHGRDEGHCRRAATDHHHPVAGIVKVLGPVLRMDDPAAERVLPFEPRRVTVVGVVAGSREQEVARHVEDLAVAGPLDSDDPVTARRREVSADDLVPEVDVRAEVVLVDRLVQVVEDLAGVSDRVVLRPRLEAEAERVEASVRPDPGVAEEVPGSADRIAGFELGEGLTGLPGLEVVAHVDAGQTGTDHDHVDVAGGRIRARNAAHADSLSFAKAACDSDHYDEPQQDSGLDHARLILGIWRLPQTVHPPTWRSGRRVKS
jgi:hypothetical protein